MLIIYVINLDPSPQNIDPSLDKTSSAKGWAGNLNQPWSKPNLGLE